MQFGKLKFVAAVRGRRTVADIRRDKLLAKLDEQIGLATALVTGGEFGVKRARLVTKEGGVRVRELVDVRVKQWWWRNSDSKLLFTVQYGTKALELAKGKTAVEVASLPELVEALQSVRQAAEAGELDSHIELASGALASAFKAKGGKGH
jgi:hypothetical protein